MAGTLTQIEMTKKEYEKLEARLDILTRKITYSNGISYFENGYRNCLSPSEYMEARKEAIEIRKKLENAKIVEKVALGSKVTLESDGKIETYQLVVNPIPKISNCLLASTELGKALIGTTIGDVIYNNETSYTVIAIATN